MIYLLTLSSFDRLTPEISGEFSTFISPKENIRNELNRKIKENLTA